MVASDITTKPNDPPTEKEITSTISPEQLERARAEVKAILEHAINPSAPRLKRSRRGWMTPSYPDRRVGFGLIMKAIGTADGEFLQGILDQFVELCFREGELNMERVNFVLSVMKGIEPRNQVEAMLGLQMAAVHMASVTVCRRLEDSRDIPGLDIAERALNRVTRTFAAQMAALNRFRSSGEQKITVQYVTVKDGSQAIVGDVLQEMAGERSGRQR